MSSANTGRNETSQNKSRNGNSNSPSLSLYPLPSPKQTAYSTFRVRKLARKAYDLKKQQRDEKVAALVNAEPGSVKEKMFQRIERVEYTKAMFLRLPSIKSKPSGGISLVKVPTDLPDKPKEAKEWRTVTEPDEIEQLIMERQQSCLH